MQKPSKLEAEARAKLGAAARVRRLARGLSQAEDQERLEQLAKELDAQAIQLEAQAAASRLRMIPRANPRANPTKPLQLRISPGVKQ
jgi:transcriptional regulator with XRE-family HTH domain